jgi:hypothetical protein
MRKLLLGLMAVSALAIAAPVFAHEDDQGFDENWSAASYQDFTPMYRHIWQGIQHGISDGSYTQWEARRFYRELQSIRARAWWEQRSGNYDPQDIGYRLQSLHERMHIAHERGHERMNNDWNYNGGYYGGPR